MSLNIFEIQPNVVSVDILQYCMMFTGVTGVGKTSTMNNILSEASIDGKKPLFLMFEDRYQHIDGIMAIKINSVSDLINVISQLNRPEAKKIFSCVVIDTVDKFEELMETFTISKNTSAEILKDLGAFGEGTQRFRAKLRYIQKIRNLGFPVHFIAQSVVNTDITNKTNPNLRIHSLKINKNTNQYFTESVSMLGYIYVGENKERYITFENSFNNQCAFGNNDKIEYLKSSFTVPVAIPVTQLKNVLIESIKNNNTNTIEKNTLQPKTQTISFEDLKQKGINLGNNLIEAGYSNEVMSICNEQLGQEIQFIDLIESQYDICEVIVNLLEKLAKDKKIIEP